LVFFPGFPEESLESSIAFGEQSNPIIKDIPKVNDDDNRFKSNTV
jgi:hypothetical protein